MEKYYKKLRSLVQILRYLCPFESSQMEFSMDFLRWNFPSGGSSIYQILRYDDENPFEPSTWIWQIGRTRHHGILYPHLTSLKNESISGFCFQPSLGWFRYSHFWVGFLNTVINIVITSMIRPQFMGKIITWGGCQLGAWGVRACALLLCNIFSTH